jgi:hypothetical protein
VAREIRVARGGRKRGLVGRRGEEGREGSGPVFVVDKVAVARGVNDGEPQPDAILLDVCGQSSSHISRYHSWFERKRRKKGKETPTHRP